MPGCFYKNPGTSILSLTLFKSGVLFVNNIQLAFTANNFTINAALFYGCPNFHDIKVFLFAISYRFSR